MKKIFAAAFLLIFTSSCATQQFKVSEATPKATPEYQKSQPFFVYGIGQTKQANAAEVCGGDHKVAQVTNTLVPWQAIIGALQQVYVPRTTTINCE